MLVDFVFHRDAPARRGGRPGGHRRRQGDPGTLMPIVLSRVDDRLVHGQVVIGWGRPLGVEFIALVDEGVAASPWEQDLYRMAVPPEIDMRFVTVAEAAGQLAGWQAGERRGLLLTGDVDTMAALHRADPAVVHRINLGGIHHRAGPARAAAVPVPDRRRAARPGGA